MTGRELAWRVLANEVLASSEAEKGTGEKAPSYVITPLGARMNRVAMVGTISPSEHPGVSSPDAFLRRRLTDPTGTVVVTAGSFQPQGKSDLETILVPTPVLVVGKAALYRGGGTLPAVSIRAESVTPVPDTDCRALTAEAASQTLERLDLVLQLRGQTPPSDAELAQAGTSSLWVRGARASILRYPTLDPEPYYEALRAVLLALRGAPVPDSTPSPPVSQEGTPTEVIRVVHARTPPAAPVPPSGSKALEGRLLEILDQLSEESPDGYADMDQLVERAARHGIAGERMEELLNYLSENGTLEEPLVGKFRRADGPPRE